MYQCNNHGKLYRITEMYKIPKGSWYISLYEIRCQFDFSFSTGHQQRVHRTHQWQLISNDESVLNFGNT